MACVLSLFTIDTKHTEKNIRKKNPSNVMHKHDVEKHNGVKQNYTAKLIQADKGLLHISLREAILIAAQHHGTTMNDRLERGRGTGIIRIEPITRQGVT